MRGNAWKTEGKNPQAHERRVRLLRYLARKLSQADTFVLFHIDGDRTWKESPTSENCAKFAKLVQIDLPQIAAHRSTGGPRARGRAPVSVEPPPLHLDRLLLLCPFRSIEAWLYQNVRAAVDVCRREHRGTHVPELQAWEARREAIDELPAPEEVVCLGKAYNLELAARGFPASEVYAVKNRSPRAWIACSRAPRWCARWSVRAPERRHSPRDAEPSLRVASRPMAPSPAKIKLAVAALVVILTAARARQNLALHRPVTVSSTRFGDASAVVNGVIEWGSYALHTKPDRPAWFTVDLQGEHPIGEIRIFGRGDALLNEDAPPLLVETSLDNRTFQRVGTCDAVYTQASPCHVYPTGVSARYVRLEFLYLVLSELEVYEAR